MPRCAGGKPYSMCRSYPHTTTPMRPCHTATLHQLLSTASLNCARRRPIDDVVRPMRAGVHPLQWRGATARVASSSTCRYLAYLAAAGRYQKQRQRCSVRRPALQFQAFEPLYASQPTLPWLQPQNTLKPPKPRTPASRSLPFSYGWFDRALIT